MTVLQAAGHLHPGPNLRPGRVGQGDPGRRGNWCISAVRSSSQLRADAWVRGPATMSRWDLWGERGYRTYRCELCNIHYRVSSRACTSSGGLPDSGLAALSAVAGKCSAGVAITL